VASTRCCSPALDSTTAGSLGRSPLQEWGELSCLVRGKVSRAALEPLPSTTTTMASFQERLGRSRVTSPPGLEILQLAEMPCASPRVSLASVPRRARNLIRRWEAAPTPAGTGTCAASDV